MTDELIVSTSGGRGRGRAANGVLAYRGLPYAADPVGSLRFAEPSPHPGWDGIRDATRPGPAVPQLPSRLNGVMGDPGGTWAEAGSLTVNVWTPDLDGSRPVLFWLHGGANMSGSASWPWYDGARLAREQDIVVVTANYRLGVFGFGFFPELGPGNVALADHAAALQWVVENVARFGGDPRAITVGGQSAGAHAATGLATGSATRRHVRRLILQSATPALAPMSRLDAAQAARSFMDAQGVEPADIARLKEISAIELLETSGRMAGRPVGGNAATTAAMGPVALDDADGPPNPTASLVALDMPVLAGSTRHEMASFYRQAPAIAALSDDEARGLLGQQWGTRAAPLYGHYRELMPEAAPGEVLEQITSDGLFAVPLVDIAEQRAAAGRPTYLYRFDWGGSRFGACHCIELPFLFGNRADWAGSPMLADIDPAEFDAVGASLRAEFGAFIRAGIPSAEWQPYDTDRRLTMRFQRGTELVEDLSGPARVAFAAARA